VLIEVDGALVSAAATAADDDAVWMDGCVVEDGIMKKGNNITEQ